MLSERRRKRLHLDTNGIPPGYEAVYDRLYVLRSPRGTFLSGTGKGLAKYKLHAARYSDKDFAEWCAETSTGRFKNVKFEVVKYTEA